MNNPGAHLDTPGKETSTPGGLASKRGKAGKRREARHICSGDDPNNRQLRQERLFGKTGTPPAIPKG